MAGKNDVLASGEFKAVSPILIAQATGAQPEPQTLTPAQADASAGRVAKSRTQLNIPRSAVKEMKVVDTDIVVSTTDGRKLYVRDGAVRSMFEPSFSIEFQDGTTVSGQEIIQSNGLLQVGNVGATTAGSPETLAEPQVVTETAGGAAGTTAAAAAAAAETSFFSSYWPWLLAAAPIVGGVIARSSSSSSSSGNNNSNSDSGTPPTIYTLKTPTAPNENYINANDVQSGVTFSGVAKPNAALTVALGTTAYPETVQADSLGNWQVTFKPEQLPQADKKYVLQVRETGSAAVATAEITIDTVADTPIITTTTGPLQNQLIDGKEKAAGVTLSGTAEAGASVAVNWSGSSYGEKRTTADSAGYWSVTYASSDVPADSDSTTISVTQTDKAGNKSAAATFDVAVKTSMQAPTINAVTADDTINNTEKTNGVTVSGKTVANASITLIWGNVTRLLSANSRGEFSTEFKSAEMPAQEGASTIAVTAVDSYSGNSASNTRSVYFDTVTNTPTISTIGQVVNSVDTIYYSQASYDGKVTIKGTAEKNSTVVVQWGTESVTANVGADGKWAADFTLDKVPAASSQATSVVVSAKDAAGNTATSDTYSLLVANTPPANVTITTPIAADNSVNGTEANDGVILSGTGPAGGQIRITWANDNTLKSFSQTVKANAATGKWFVTFSKTQIPATSDGSNSPTTITAEALDSADNVLSKTTKSVAIDLATTAPSLNQVGVLVNNSTDTVNSSHMSSGLTLSGKAEAGATVTIKWGTLTITSGPADLLTGAWSIVLGASDMDTAYKGAINGSATLKYSATDAAGNISSTFSKDISFDLTAPNLSLASIKSGTTTLSKATGGYYINATQITQDLVVNGYSEPGQLVSVTFGGLQRNVTADTSTGAWTAIFTATEMGKLGDKSYAVAMSTTDAAGNAAKLNEAFVLDRVVKVTIDTVAGDNTINSTEAQSLKLTGTASEAGATVTLNWKDSTGAIKLSYTVSTTTDPTDSTKFIWTKSLTAADLAKVGQGSTTLTADIKDIAGNTATVNKSVTVNTNSLGLSITTIAVDDKINIAESSTAGFEIVGKAAAGAKVAVEWTPQGGTLFTSSVVTADASGNWKVPVAAVQTPSDGSASFTARASDSSGNTASASKTVGVSRTAPTVTLDNVGDGTDAYVNANEVSSGVLFSGTATKGATVDISWGTLMGSATANATTGAWTWRAATNSKGGILEGATSASVTATDIGGNSTTTTKTFTLDTNAPDLVKVTGLAGDGVINDAEWLGSFGMGGTGEAGATVSVLWGGNIMKTATVSQVGAWSVSFPVADGRPTSSANTFVITQTDPAGNTSSSYTHTGTIDRAAPTKILAAYVALQANSDTGVAGDGITADNTPWFDIVQGIEANATAHLFNDINQDGKMTTAEIIARFSSGTTAVSSAVLKVGGAVGDPAWLNLTKDLATGEYFLKDGNYSYLRIALSDKAGNWSFSDVLSTLVIQA